MLTTRKPLRSVVLCAALLSSAALGQDDDLLTPLTDEPAPPRVTPKKKQKAPANPRASELEALEQLIAPLEAPTELIVTLADPLILGARLFVDGKDIGWVNGKPLLVKPGEHRVEVKRPGFSPFGGTVIVPHGGREKVVVSLFPSAGVLTVQSTVPDAEVFVDGKSVGRTPVRQHLLKPGNYEVRVVKEGYVPEVVRLAVRPGKDYNLSPSLVAQADRPARPRLEPVATASPQPLPPEATRLTPEQDISSAPPWYGRWYVWAGAAAVAIAGGTAAVVAAQPRTYRPNEVCGETCSDVINAPGARGVLIAPKVAF